MKNIMKYYYNFEISSYKKNKSEYKFYEGNTSYSFVQIDRSESEIDELSNLINRLNYIGVPCHKIIANVDNNLVTYVNGRKYVLLYKYIDSEDLITINDIIDFGKRTSFNWEYLAIDRKKWKKLWIAKLEYFGYQLSQIGKKYSLIYNSFNYYEGLCETALQLLNEELNGTVSVSHKRLSVSTTITDFYNPLNFIIDYKVRNVSEFFKEKIISGVDISNELKYCLEKYILTNDDKKLFFIRMIFPSFYFDAYEKTLFEMLNHEKLTIILDKNINYENMLKKIYTVLKLYINLPYIEWLN